MALPFKRKGGGGVGPYKLQLYVCQIQLLFKSNGTSAYKGSY